MKLPRTAIGIGRERGFSLIELMVVILICLVATVAIFGILATYEGKKRTTTSVNDVVQSGNFGLFYIDKLVRGAGTGFSAAWQTSYGCPLFAYNAAGVVSTNIFPAASLSPDFSAIETLNHGNFVLAPVLIAYQGSSETDGNGNTSDALIVMSGNSGGPETATALTAVPASSTALPSANLVPFLSNDLIMVTDAPASTQAPCMLTQVASAYLQGSAATTPTAPLPLGGTFYRSPIGTQSLTNYSKNAQLLDIGNPGGNTAPVFSILGVNANHVLVDYHLLSNTGVAAEVADGVYEMHALYGIDTTGSGVISQWVSPSAPPWDLLTLSSQLPGSAASNTGAYAIERIKAIRIGFFIRTDLPENTKTGLPVTSGPLQLFADLPNLTYNRALSIAEQGYRWRALEATIPIRNNLLIAK